MPKKRLERTTKNALVASRGPQRPGRWGMPRLRLKARLRLILGLWLLWSLKRPRTVLLLATVLAAFALDYSLGHLKVNTYPGNMLSDALPWRQDKLAFERAFPRLRDSLILVIDGPTADQARHAADRTAHRLMEDPADVEEVFYPPLMPFFRQQALLYQDLDALEAKSNRIAALQPFLGDLASDWSLPRLFHLLGRALQAHRIDELQPDILFGQLATTLDALAAGATHPLPWGEVMGGPSDPKDRQLLIEVMPRLDYSSLAPGRAVIDRIRASYQLPDITSEGIRIRMTGAAALSIDELQSASLGAQMASLGSFLGVTLVMFLGLRSLWLVCAVQFALVLGLIYTALLAALTLGQLNLISVAFSVMYIGIGADYAIYLCLRYREFAGSGMTQHAALRRAVHHVGGSIGIGTLTTAVGFFCFIPTSYRGVAELGMISGAGMFVSLMVTLLILPAFLTLSRPPSPTRLRTARLPLSLALGIRWVCALPSRFARAMALGALGLAILAGIQLSHCGFDLNPLNLQDSSKESVTTFKELLDRPDLSPWSLSVLVPDEAHALALKDALSRDPVVSEAVTVHDFLPAQVPEKLEILDQLSILLGMHGDLRFQNGTADPEGTLGFQSLRMLLAHLADAQAGQGADQSIPGAAQLTVSLARLIARVEQGPPGERGLWMDKAFDQLVGRLPEALGHLFEGLGAQPVQLSDLPESLRDRWVSSEGAYRLDVRPQKALTDPEEMTAFVRRVKALAPHATGAPVLFIESGRAVVTAFLEAFGGALLAITVVLWFTLRRRMDVLCVLLPLILASLLTGALMGLLKVPFNFANIIALPLVFGMGVDNCIHLVHRFRTAPPADGLLLRTSTALAVVLSALTNLSGFGNLSVSPHQGMASMGIMLSLGIAATLVSSLLLLPALLKLTESPKARR